MGVNDDIVFEGDGNYTFQKIVRTFDVLPLSTMNPSNESTVPSSWFTIFPTSDVNPPTTAPTIITNNPSSIVDTFDPITYAPSTTHPLGCFEGSETNQNVTFIGECNYDNFYSAATDFGCTQSQIYRYLQVNIMNETQARMKLDQMCSSAKKQAHHSFHKF